VTIGNYLIHRCGIRVLDMQYLHEYE